MQPGTTFRAFVFLEGTRSMAASETHAEALWLPSAVAAALCQHAIDAYPEECCGALFGSTAGAVEDVMRFDNAATRDPRRRFLVTAADYRRAEAHADRGGGSLIGFYHSHPDQAAEPSATDLAEAWPNLSYVIVSVRARRADAVRSWKLAADRTRFIEQPLLSDRD
jgi:proteasome lid subunit RPN8/RPN11